MYHQFNQFRPENALKRAEELISVGQKREALRTLHDVLSNNRRKFHWQKPFEDVMSLCVDLCVELRKGKTAKDALIQYRQLCQNTNMNSLEVIIKKYLDLTRMKCQEAQEKTNQAIMDIEDLDEEESPESLIVQSVSGENSKARADREILVPWLRFLWESFRNVLETLRVNSKLEKTYHETARTAFEFCLQHNRKVEFRHLCDLLRHHLSAVQRSQAYTSHQENRIILTNPETVQVNLETRFKQLAIATRLELWQEAWKTVEDITHFMRLSKRAVKPHLMGEYYDRLAQVFWMSKDYKFHAYALFKLFSIVKRTKKNVTGEEIQNLSNLLVLSVLCVPLTDSVPKAQQFMSEEADFKLMNAAFLHAVEVPSRNSLMKELVARGALEEASEDVQKLFKVLEREFDPLNLADKGQAALEELAKHAVYARYSDPLINNLILRLLLEVSEVYDTITLEHLQHLTRFVDFSRVESVLTSTLQDPVGSCLFKTTVKFDFTSNVLVFSRRGLDSDTVREQLSGLSRSLESMVEQLHPGTAAERLQRRSALFDKVRQQMVEENQSLLNRRLEIEGRKLQAEHLKREQQARSEQLRKIEQRAREEEEQLRVKLERQAQLEERQKQERIEKEMQKALELQVEFETREGLKIPKTVAQLAEEVDMSEPGRLIGRLVELQGEVESEHRRIRDEKLRKLAKKLDFLERARREEESHFLEERFTRQRLEDMQHYEELVSKEAEMHGERHRRDMLLQESLKRLKPDVQAYIAMVMEHRNEQFNEARREQQIRRAEKRKAWEKEQKRKREERAERKRVEDELRRKEEEERRQQEEEDRARREAEEAKNAKIKAQLEASLQRQREEELRAHRAREELLNRAGKSTSTSTASSTKTGGDAAEPASTEAGGAGVWRPRSGRTAGSAAAAAAAASTTSSSSGASSGSSTAWKPRQEAAAPAATPPGGAWRARNTAAAASGGPPASSSGGAWSGRASSNASSVGRMVGSFSTRTLSCCSL